MIPVTRQSENSKAYNRKRTRDWKKELPVLRPLWCYLSTNESIAYIFEIDIMEINVALDAHYFKDVAVMKQTFFEQFEEYCITPGMDSGKARSYSRAIQYLCDYLNISQVDGQTVTKLKSIENTINDKHSREYQNLLIFLAGRCQKSYLEGGFIKAALTYFFAFCKEINM